MKTLDQCIDVKEILEEIISKIFTNLNTHKKRKNNEQDLPTQDQDLKVVWGRTIKICENEKNQSCSKLPEMARTLVENEFRTF